MTKDLLEAMLNDEQGCLDAVEEDYGVTEYLTIDKRWRDD